jgi:hypothetical protein
MTLQQPCNGSGDLAVFHSLEATSPLALQRTGDRRAFVPQAGSIPEAFLSSVW